MLYRIISVVLYLTMVSAAPQGANSDITYVKMRPSSPSIEDQQSQPRSLAARESRIENVPLTIPGNVDSGDHNVRKVRSDGHGEDKPQLKSEERTDAGDSASVEVEEDAIRQARSQDEDVTDVPYDDREEKNVEEEEFISETEEASPTERPTYAKSYLQRGNNFVDLVSNHVVNYKEKRKFKSKCRCERLWNCPKLQITVPRCPTDYFMCCF